MSTVTLTLIGKPGCHLCDEARTLIQAVILELPVGAPDVTVAELSVEDSPELHERYVEDIPVILIDGRQHACWRVDPLRLRTALLEKNW